MVPKTIALRTLEVVVRAGTRAIGWFAAASIVLALKGVDPTWLWLSRAVAGSWLHWPMLALLALAALAPLHWLEARMSPRGFTAMKLARRGVLLVVAGLSFQAAITCWIAWARGLHSMFPVPVSAIIGVLLTASALSRPARRSSGSATAPAWTSRLLSASATAAAMVGLVGAQIAGIAYTDHRRPADAIVVLGARVYENGRPSEALAQRVATACELYAEGYAPKLLLSGGRDSGARVSEPEAMRELALRCGVPADAILLDEEGVDTHATAVNTRAILGEGARVLAVSHGYHLARLQLALEGQHVVPFTVPATERILLPGKPWYVAREIVAWAVYLARG